MIGRVLRIPTGIFEHVALNDAGNDDVVIAHAQIASMDAILARDVVQPSKEFVFAEWLARKAVQN